MASCSPGVFRFSHNLEDADAVLAYLRNPVNAARLGIDTRRIAMAGHSMGGWVVVHTAAHDRGLVGAVIVSAADVGKQSELPNDRLVGLMADKPRSTSPPHKNSVSEKSCRVLR
jgi:uncharacterized protein